MMIIGNRKILAALMLFTLSAWSSMASADEPSKEACIESHSRGQDAREQGKLSLARKLFMTCAQPACPALVQNDCARYADDLDRHQSWLSFVARDAAGNDLPDTAVYIDDVLLMTRLDDGKAHEVDPGKHVVRFEYGDRERVVTLVVGSGEKGRTVVATFDGGSTATALKGEPIRGPALKNPHALGARALIGAGAGMMVGGATLGLVGLSRVPADCSVSSHVCTSAPGSASYDKAAAGVRLSNTGWVAGGVGAAALAAGLVWYFTSAKAERRTLVSPMLTPSAVGVRLSGRL